MAHFKLITDDHVKTALKANKGESAELISWEREDFAKKGDNYGSAITSIKVHYKVDGIKKDESYIVKINQEGEDGFEDMRYFMVAAFQKEIEFLGKIAPDLNAEMVALGQEPLRFPRQYHSSTVKYNELLFIEDLRKRGFKLHDRMKGLDVAHTELVLKEVARLHAASFLLQAKYREEELSERYPFMSLNWHNHSEKAERFFNMFATGSMDIAVKILDKVGGYDKAKKWLLDHRDDPCELFKKHITRNPMFDVFNHGDCWNNNFLFRYDDEGAPVEVMLIDLQLYNMSSLTHDLNLFLYSSLTGNTRKPNLERFLRTYYDTFCGVLGSGEMAIPFTYDQFLQEFKDKNEFGLLFMVMYVEAVVKPSEEAPDFSTKSEEEFNKVLAEFNESSLKSLDTNPHFGPRYLAVFDEMTENGVFD